MPTLFCENGHHPWERPVQPGRKPANCPDHPIEQPIVLNKADTARIIAAKGKPLRKPAKALTTPQDTPQTHPNSAEAKRHVKPIERKAKR